MSREILQAEFIPVDLDNLLNVKGDSKLVFDIDSFNNGLEVGSYFAGMATALFNAGLEEESVAEFLITWVKEHGGE